MTPLRFSEIAAGAAAILLMGVCAFRLVRGLGRMLSGRETMWGGKRPGRLPLGGMAKSAAAMLASRLLLFAAAYALYRLTGAGEDSFRESFGALWRHWDVRHYEGIAKEGYPAAGDARLRLVFFPLYPWLMRLFGPLTGGDLLLSGTLLSLLCACVASALLYALAEGITDSRRAALAVCYFAANPMSVFLGCAYTEALFLCLTLAAALLHYRGRPWCAALCGFMSALTRMPGVVIAGLPLIALLERTGKRRLRPRDVLEGTAQILLVFGGLAVYWALNAHVTGNPFQYLAYQRENWFQQPGTFWDSTANTVHYFFVTRGEGDWLWTWGFQLFALFYGYALLAFVSGRLPYALQAYSFVYVAVVFAPTWLLSGARYLYGLISLPLLQALACEGREAHAVRLSVSGLLLALFLYGYTLAARVL